MAASVALSSEELRIIGHSINWQLNVPYEHTLPPQLSEPDAQVLRLLFNELVSQNRHSLFSDSPVLIEIKDPYLCTDGRMQLPPDYFRLMTDAVGSFVKEVGSSPVEMEVITGSTCSKTSELLARLQPMLR